MKIRVKISWVGQSTCNSSALWWETSSRMHWTRISTSAFCGSYPIFGSTSTSGIPRWTDICKYGDNDNDNNNQRRYCSLHRVLWTMQYHTIPVSQLAECTSALWEAYNGYFSPLRVLGLPPLSRSLELLGTTDSSSTRALWWTEGEMAWERCDDEFEMLK